jgi:hypothetical protein
MDVEKEIGWQKNSEENRTTSITLSEQSLVSLLDQDNGELKGLILILKFAGLYSFQKCWTRYVTYTIIFFMWLAIISVLVNLFIYWPSDKLNHQIGNVTWMFHSATTYTIVAYDMIFCNGRLLIFMKSIVSGKNNANFSNFSLLPETYCRDLHRVGWLTTLAVYCGVIGNIICVGYLYIHSDGLYIVLRVTRSLWFDVLGLCLWYFYSYGWVISIPYVCIPAYALHCRIKSYIDFIKANGKETPSSLSSKQLLSVEKTMEWYDELHSANKLLVMNVSLLLTADIVLCSLLSVFLLHVSFSPSLLLSDFSFLSHSLSMNSRVKFLLWELFG